MIAWSLGSGIATAVQLRLKFVVGYTGIGHVRIERRRYRKMIE